MKYDKIIWCEGFLIYYYAQNKPIFNKYIILIIHLYSIYH